jgi:chromosome segregation ATPase
MRICGGSPHKRSADGGVAVRPQPRQRGEAAGHSQGIRRSTMRSDRSVARSFGKAFQVCTLPVLLAALMGCSATEQKSGAAKTAFRDFRKSIDRMESRVDASVRAMDRLQSPKTFDHDAAYADFVTEYFNIAADAAGVREHAEFMREAGAEYFLTAESAAKAEGNEKAVAKAKSRAEAVRPKYDQLQQSLSNARDAYKPYQAAVAQAAKSLSKDHSPAQVAAISDQFNTAKQRAGELKTAIGKLRSDLDAMEHNLDQTK